MDLKKITAFLILVLLTLPSLTMGVMADPGDSDEGVGLECAIERARLYLYNVRTSAETLAQENPEFFQDYLNEIYDLLGQEWEAPEILLKTTGTVGTGYEERIVITMPTGFTLGELETISWSEFLVDGYPPHVDVILDMGEGSTDALVFEYAYNYESHAAETWPTYDALTGAWYQTFSDDGNGPSVIDDESNAWLSSGAPGPLTGAPTFYYHTLGYWKVTGDQRIDGETLVLRLEIEVDNWIAQTEAYVDDIKINGVPYNFEEEPEYLGAEGFLAQASAYLEDGEVNLAARSLASARNILGRVKGLLNSMVKIHKVTRVERFIQQFSRRIEGIEAKVERLSGRFGDSGTDNMMASMGLAKGKINQLGEDLSEDNLDDVIDELEITTESIDEDLEELNDDDISPDLMTIDRLEAKIRVLNASAERLSRKGYNTDAVVDELKRAEALLEEIMGLHVEDVDTVETESLIEEADEIVSDAKGKLKEIRKEHQNKGKGH